MNQETLHRELEAIDARFSGTIGVAARRLDDLLEVRFNQAEVFPAASVVKLPLLIAALHGVERGQLRLEQRYVMSPEERAGGSGVLGVCDGGLSLSLRDLLTLMIVVSDNTATNMVMDAVGGLDSINRDFAAMGLGTMRVYGKLQVPWERKTEAQRQGKLAEFTPLEALDLLERLWHGELLGQEMRELALYILSNQQYTEMIGRSLPDGTRTATKSGQITGVRNDVGFILLERPYMIAIASRGGQDLRYHVDNEGVLAVAEVSKLVHQYFSGQ